MEAQKWALRDLYRSLDMPGKNPLRDLHIALDKAVAAAYGLANFPSFKNMESQQADFILPFLLDLNLQVANKEAKGEKVTSPGLPEV